MIALSYGKHMRPLAPVALLSACLLASCAPPPFTYVEPRISQATVRTNVQPDPEPTPDRTSGSAVPLPTANDGPLARQTGTGTIVGAPSTQSFVTEGGDVSLNYVDADIKEVIRLILGNILKVNYSIDPGFGGMVTIQTVHPLRRDQLLSTLQGLLEQAGGTMTYRNGIFRISDATDEAVIPPIVGQETPGGGTQIIQLRYASARQLLTVIEPYVGDGAKIAADTGRNVLLVTGSASARQSVADLISVFDVDYLAGQSYALFAARSGDPTKLAADLTAALQPDNDAASAGAIRIVPLLVANAVMVIAPQPAALDRVSRLIAEFDRVKIAAGRNIHVYYLKNVQATDIQPILQRAVNPSAGGGLGGEVAPGNLPPTATPGQIASAPAPTPAGMQGPSGLLGGNTASMQGTQPSPPPPPALETDAGQAGANANGPQIIADHSNGALIIVATETEYATIEAAIRKLDVLPMQVLIEATIAEVTLNNQLQYGTQFFLSNNEGQATLSNAQSGATVLNPSNPISNALLFPGTLAPAFPAFTIARTLGEQQFALQALKNITDVQIISAPKLLVLDKEQARLQVGDLVPTITQSATSVISAGAPVVNNVQYQATGVILTVTPHINSGGLVTLDIEQEVSDVIPTTSSSINSPTFQQRKIQTKVVVQNGETISLAGMISDKKLKGNSGIPLMQDIPVLGALFSTQTKNNERTELLVLLTPRVINDLRGARALTDELRQRLAPGAIVP
jgi:general secretion pathway protein D